MTPGRNSWNQPALIEMPTPRKHRTVRQTSVASYAVGREKFSGRKADVLRWLAWWWNTHQASPTSSELTEFVSHTTDSQTWRDMTFGTLYVRRGLSDLQTVGLVETKETRRCAVTGKTCHTWRVTQR